MRLYVKDKFGKKIPLDISARTRRELANKIGKSFFIGNNRYYVNNVYAEPDNNDTAAGTIIGGLIGLLGGGIGVLIGGVAGGLIGGIRDNDERDNVSRFNRSRI